jgi:hypothetical protein
MSKQLVIGIIAVTLMLAFIPALSLATSTEVELNNENLLKLDNMKITSTGSGADEITTYSLTQPEELQEGVEILSLTIVTKADPFVDYGMSIKNTGVAKNFRFNFTSPVTPVVSGSNVVRSSFSASGTDGAPDVPNGVNVNATSPPEGIPVDGDGITELQVTTVSDGSTRATIGHDLAGPRIHLPGTGGVWGPFVEGFVAGPESATGWNEIRIDVNFRLSGGGDILTLNGRSDIRKSPPIPEFPVLAFPVAFVVGIFGVVCYIKYSRDE